MTWIRSNKALFVMLLVVVLIALMPLYGVLFPPLADLPQQVLVNKLLWEKLSGASHLDLEISRFLGYRLPSAIMVTIITACKLCGVPLLYLPRAIVMALISLHVVVVVTILYCSLQSHSWKSRALAVCFSVPAVAAMYSSSWFVGFIGFTLGITLLIPAILFTERFLRSGRAIDAALVFIFLALVYAAHPFALSFWFLWCVSRSLAAIVMRSFFREWKKLILLGVLFLPIVLYHVAATKGNELAPSTQSFRSQSPFVSPREWYQIRLQGLLHGAYLKADETADSRAFALAAIGLILFSSFLAFRFPGNQDLKKAVLASLILILITSWINEKFIPVPGGHWLAYDFRFTSTTYVLALALAGIVLIRFLPLATDRLRYKLLFVLLALFAVFPSTLHLLEVRKAYARFDTQARQYMTKIFNHEEPAGVALPRSRWYLDATFLKRYICLQQADCNPAGTLFQNLGGDIYPVKLKSANRVLPADAPAADLTAGLTNGFKGGEGYAGGQFSKPRGIATESHGNLYVADSGNGRIQVFDTEGKLLLAFGRTGSGSGEFKEPNGIAVDALGQIYVVDAANHKLMRFGPDGKFSKEWKGPDSGFYGPRDIAIGGDNHLYIVDQGRARIVKFDPATESFTSWGTSGSGAGQFLQATGLAIGGNFVFVADLGNDRIQVFDLDGKFIRQWEVPIWGKYVWHYPDIAFDERAKRLYVTNGWRKEVVVFGIDGSFLGHVKPTSPGELKNPSSLVLSNDGKRLYVLNTGSVVFDAGEPSISLLEVAGIEASIKK
jgi:DNA-binding beta-propeller fold protein YncE